VCKTLDDCVRLATACNDSPDNEAGWRGIVDGVVMHGPTFATTVADIKKLHPRLSGRQSTFLTQATKVARTPADVEALQALTDKGSIKDEILNAYLDGAISDANLASIVALAAHCRTNANLKRLADAGVPKCVSVDDFAKLAAALAASPDSETGWQDICDGAAAAGAPRTTTVADVKKLAGVMKQKPKVGQMLLECVHVCKSPADVAGLQELTEDTRVKDQILQKYLELAAVERTSQAIAQADRRRGR
jgi:hypothetical protein